MLQAAAAALRLIESGDVAARGTLGVLLRAEPDEPVDDGRDPWKRAMDDFRAAVEAAYDDPAAARQLWTFFTAACRTPSGVNRMRDELIAAGVPERFLPGSQAISR